MKNERNLKRGERAKRKELTLKKLYEKLEKEKQKKTKFLKPL
jgi:hypothetical protein